MTSPDATAAGRRLLVIHNPTAGGARRRRLAATLRALEALGCSLTLRATRRAGDGEALAAAAGPGDGDLLVAAGGDGTINEVVNGLLAAGKGAPAPSRATPPRAALPLAVLPLGTANVLAAELELGRDPRALARTIAHGPIRQITLGRAGERVFHSMIGVGYDAHVVAGVDLGLKRRLGKAAYVVESLRQLAAFRFPGYRLVVDGQELPAASAIVTRGRYYGGRFVCAPEAGLHQASLQVCRFTRPGAWNVLRYGACLLGGRLPDLDDYAIQPAARVTILGPEGDPLQGDGDLIGRLPVTVELAREPLGLVVPEGWRVAAS